MLGDDGVGADGGGGTVASNSRTPQSEQSLPRLHEEYSAPSPPSSHTASLEKWHVLEQMLGGEGGVVGGEGGNGGVADAHDTVTLESTSQ